MSVLYGPEIGAKRRTVAVDEKTWPITLDSKVNPLRELNLK